MKLAKLLVIVGFSYGCISMLEEEPPPPPTPQIEDTAEPKKPKPLPGKVRMLCEHGCPATMPFINIMPVLYIDVAPDADTTDTEDVAQPDVPDITSPQTCGDIYEFSTCCGNDVCESSESTFFCPGDCS